MVTIADDAERRPDQRVKDAFFIVEQDGNQLREISKRIKAGKLRTLVNAIVPFEEAPAAYANTLRDKAGYGKVVLAIPQEAFENGMITERDPW